MRKKFFICALSAFMCVQAFGCYVDTIEMAYMAVEAGGQQKVSLNGTVYNGANGLMVMQTKNPSGRLAEQLGEQIWGYCYEKDVYSSFAFNTFSVDLLGDAISSSKADLIRQLWAQHYKKQWQSGTYIYYGGNQGGFVSGQPADTQENRESLAFSFAVYEIIYDFNGSMSSLNLDTGKLIGHASGTNPSQSVAIAEGWLDALVLPCQYTGRLAELVSLSACGVQDMIVEIPEPATMALLAIGGLLIFKKRK